MASVVPNSDTILVSGAGWARSRRRGAFPIIMPTGGNSLQSHAGTARINSRGPLARPAAAVPAVANVGPYNSGALGHSRNLALVLSNLP